MASTKYQKITLPEDRGDRLPPVHIEALGVKMTLPNLMGLDMPLEMLNASITAIKNNTTDENAINALNYAAITEYLQKHQQEFMKKLETAERPVEWLNSVIEAWAELSGVDPKSK